MVGLVLTTMPKSFHVKIDVTANDCEEYSFKVVIHGRPVKFKRSKNSNSQ